MRKPSKLPKPPMRVHRNVTVPPSACLNCGKVLDTANAVGESFTEKTIQPGPGDFTICLVCGHLMIFADDMTMREPTVEEMREIGGDHRMLMIQRARAEIGLGKKKS